MTPYRYWNGINQPSSGTDPRKHVLSAVLSYVTGTHSLKTGVQWGFGPFVTRGDLNGDLVQLYRNGRPDGVQVYNTPREAREYLNADLGIFAQDSWRIDRLTLNYGIRLEYFNGEISEQDVAGRTLRTGAPLQPGVVHALLVRRRAALGRRLRSFRRRENRRQSDGKQVHGRPGARLRPAL